jgi:hypothetical protein
MYIKKFKDFVLVLENSNIQPTRFRNASPASIIDFVDELLYNTGKVDITEKFAGQHLTVEIKNNYVTVNTKDQLLRGDEPRNAAHSRWGSDITRPLIDWINAGNTLPDQTWGFEILNPNTNHDYIKYKNVDKIYIEYTGNLKDDMAEILRKEMNSVKLLTKREIKININKNESFESFKKMWEGGLKKEFELMRDTGNVNSWKISELKELIGDLLDNILVSVVDKVSPIEGIVIGTSTPIKLQTNNFLKIQRVQMPLYSIFKTHRTEIGYLKDNPTISFDELKSKFNLRLDSIYSHNLRYSLYETVKYYLEQNRKLEGINVENYRRWLTTSESDELLSNLTRENAGQIYQQIYDKVQV